MEITKKIYLTSLDDIDWERAQPIVNKMTDEEKHKVFALFNYWETTTKTFENFEHLLIQEVPELLGWEGERTVTEDNIEEILTEYPTKYHDALKDYVTHMWYPSEMHPMRVRQKYLTEYFNKYLKENHCYECNYCYENCSAEDSDHCKYRSEK